MAAAIPVRPLSRTLMIEMAGQRRRVLISTSPYAIGRSDDCDAVIPDFRVSRLHAKILQEGEQYFIAVADSRHGTFLNVVRVQRAQLKSGQPITLSRRGLCLLLLEEESPSRRAARHRSRRASGLRHHLGEGAHQL